MEFLDYTGAEKCSICRKLPADCLVVLLPGSAELPCCEFCQAALDKKYKNRVAVESGGRAMKEKAKETAHQAYDKLRELGVEDATLAECAQALNQAGMKTSRGGPFSQMAVKRAFEALATSGGWEPDGPTKARDFLKTLSL